LFLHVTYISNVPHWSHSWAFGAFFIGYFTRASHIRLNYSRIVKSPNSAHLENQLCSVKLIRVVTKRSGRDIEFLRQGNY